MVDKSQYNNLGYLLIQRLFDESEIAAVLDDARQVFLEQFIVKGYTAVTQVTNISEAEFNDCLYRLFEEDSACLMNCGKQVQHLISLHRLSLDERLVSLLRALGLGFPVISTRPVMFFNHPRLAKKQVFYKVDAHQDWRSMQGSLNAVVIWVPLVDVDKDLGALEIVPGSHLNGLLTDKIEEGFGMVNVSDEMEQKFISVEVKRGDALVFSSLLIHRSGENVTPKPRWSCHFRYNDLKEPTFIQRRYPHAYIYKPQEELITGGFPTVSEVKNVFS